MIKTLRGAVRSGAAGLLLVALGAFGQGGAQEARTVSGRVVRVVAAALDSTGKPRSQSTAVAAIQKDTIGVVPVPSLMVTLHRVGRDSQFPLDSVRSRPDGSYNFSYRKSGADDAVYFTSASWGGITYFTAPLRTAKVTGNDAEITVFDTTTTVFPLKVAGRHLIISASDSANERTVVEVFELSNDSIRTIISPDEKSAPTWSVSIPKQARDVRMNAGEISDEAFKKADDRVMVFSAIAPGVKQVSFSYRLPSEVFPLPFPVEQGATVLEVLLEEPMGTVVGAGLQAADPVTLENRNFRRFLAQDVADTATLDIRLPTGPSVGRNMYIGGLLAGIGTIMLLILWRAMQRKRLPNYAGIPPVRVKEAPLADRLAREIADLDATYAKHATPSDAMKKAYDERRAELKDALAAELARR